MMLKTGKGKNQEECANTEGQRAKTREDHDHVLKC